MGPPAARRGPPLAPADQDRVVTHREGAHVYHAVTDDDPCREPLPGRGIQPDAGQRSQMLGEGAQQRGQLGTDVTRPWPPRPVEDAFARCRRLQPEQCTPRPHGMVHTTRQLPGTRGCVGVGHRGPPVRDPMRAEFTSPRPRYSGYGVRPAACALRRPTGRLPDGPGGPALPKPPTGRRKRPVSAGALRCHSTVGRSGSTPKNGARNHCLDLAGPGSRLSAT